MADSLKNLLNLDAPDTDCVHFNGLRCKVCMAGVAYDTVKTFHTPAHGFSLPCVPSMSQVEARPCPKYQPKPEEPKP